VSHINLKPPSAFVEVACRLVLSTNLEKGKHGFVAKKSRELEHNKFSRINYQMLQKTSWSNFLCPDILSSYIVIIILRST